MDCAQKRSFLFQFLPIPIWLTLVLICVFWLHLWGSNNFQLKHLRCWGRGHECLPFVGKNLSGPGSSHEGGSVFFFGRFLVGTFFLGGWRWLVEWMLCFFFHGLLRSQCRKSGRNSWFIVDISRSRPYQMFMKLPMNILLSFSEPQKSHDIKSFRKTLA